MEATIRVEAALLDKEGEKNGKKWRRYKIVAEGGHEYKTFDGALFNIGRDAVGHQAKVIYEQGQFGYDLKHLEVVHGEEPVIGRYTPPPAAKTPDGETDWDLIGLRKTRCALWCAVLANNNLHVGDARQLVLQAEVDIFHRPPAGEHDDIPFE